MSDFFSLSENENATPMAVLLSALKACGIGLLAALVLIFAASVASYAMPDPASAAFPAALAALYLAGAATGFAGAKLNRDAALWTGVAAGALFLLFSLLLSFAFEGEAGAGLSLGTAVLLRVLIVAAAVLGTLIGMKTNIAKHTHRRAHKRKRR